MPCAKCGLPITRTEAGPSAMLCQCEAPEYVEPTEPPAPDVIVPAPCPADRALSIPRQGTPLNRCPTNLDLVSMRGRALLFHASDPSDYPIADTEPARIRAVSWAMVPETREDEETGEVSEYVATVLYDPFGKTLKSSATHMPMRIMALLQLFTPEEWANGIPLCVQLRRSKRGRMYHHITLDADAMSGQPVQADDDAPRGRKRGK